MAKEKCWVGFVIPEKGIDWTYDCIMWAFRSPEVHIFVCFGEKLEDSTVYQTTPTVTSKGSFQGRLQQAPVECWEVLDIDTKAARAWCEANLNNKYDYIGIAGLTFILIGEKIMNFFLTPFRKRWIGLNFPNLIHSRKKFYCSEYVIGALKAGKCPKVYETKNSMAPEQRIHFRKNPDVYKFVFSNVIKEFKPLGFFYTLKGVLKNGGGFIREMLKM